MDDEEVQLFCDGEDAGWYVDNAPEAVAAAEKPPLAGFGALAIHEVRLTSK